jgi:hypothetical protein
MEAGQAVRYRGKPTVFGDGRHLDPGASGEVISVHRFEETWVAVWWEGLTRPTFHLEKELELPPE